MIHWAFFGASSELDAKQATVEAFLGKQCSYYGCYERQARARFYTFSTVSCAWTEPAGLGKLLSLVKQGSLFKLVKLSTHNDIVHILKHTASNHRGIDF